MKIQQCQVGSAVRLDLQGRLIAADDSVLKDTVNSLLFQGIRTILLNLEEVSQVDTTGLSALIAVKHAVDSSGATVTLLKLPPRVHSLLVVTRLITVFDVVDSETDAVNAQSGWA